MMMILVVDLLIILGGLLWYLYCSCCAFWIH